MSIAWVLYTALGLYLASSFCYLGSLRAGTTRLENAGRYLLIHGFFVHLFALILRYFVTGYMPITSLHESLSFFALCMAGFFIFLRRVYKVESLGALFAPVIALMLIGALLAPAAIRPLPPVLRSYWLPIHTAFAFIGNAIFFSGFLVSIVYLFIERGIKRKRMRDVSGHFPSLETLDRINYKCMSYGFPLLTIGIITGAIWAEMAWGHMELGPERDLVPHHVAHVRDTHPQQACHRLEGKENGVHDDSGIRLGGRHLHRRQPFHRRLARLYLKDHALNCPRLKPQYRAPRCEGKALHIG